MSAPSRHRQDEQSGIVSTGAATAKPTTLYGASLPPACVPTLPPKTTSPDDGPRARSEKRPSAASSGTSPERSTGSSLTRHQPELAPPCAASAKQGGITITQAAQALRTHPARISEIEHGRDHNHHLATRYQNWLRTHQAHQPAPSSIDNHRSINAAVICVARRRCNIILAMLKTQTPYQPRQTQPETPKNYPTRLDNKTGDTPPAGHPPTHPPGRHCTTDSCTARLSIYNPADHCHLHSPTQYPRSPKPRPARPSGG